MFLNHSHSPPFLNISHTPPPYLDPHFISHYRVVLVLLSIISNVFTITTLVALYHKKFHLRRVIFLSILMPNILLTYTFLLLQPLVILPYPIVHLFGPLPFSAAFQLLMWSFLLTTTLAVFAYSLLYVFFTAILRNNSWNHLTAFLLAGLVIGFTAVNTLLALSSTEQEMSLSLSLIFPHWAVNYAFVEYLVLLMIGCGIITFTIERAVTSMREAAQLKQSTVNLQWSLLKLLVCYGVTFLFVFALPGFLLLCSLQFKWKIATGRPVLYLGLLAPAVLVCPAVFFSHFLHVKQFRIAVRGRRNTISPKFSTHHMNITGK